MEAEEDGYAGKYGAEPGGFMMGGFPVLLEMAGEGWYG